MGMEALTKPLLLYFCLCLVTSFFAPSLVVNSNTPLGLFNLTYNETSGDMNLGSGFMDSSLSSELDINPSDTSTSNIFKTGVDWVSEQFQRIADGLNMIINVVKILFKFLFCPILIFFSPLFTGCPFVIKILLSAPLLIITLMGFLGVIRGN